MRQHSFGRRKARDILKKEVFQMQTIYQPDKPSPMLIAEIQYFMAFSALKKMVEKEKVTMEDAKKMNLLLAERFGVRSYEISSAG